MRMRKRGKAVGFAVKLVADGRGVVTTLRSKNRWEREVEGKLLLGNVRPQEGKEVHSGTK